MVSKEIARCGINVPLSKGADTAYWPCGNTELIDELRAGNVALESQVERLTAWQKEAGDLIGRQVNEITDLHNKIERLRAALEAIHKSLSIGFMDLTEAQEIAEYINKACAEALGR